MPEPTQPSTAARPHLSRWPILALLNPGEHMPWLIAAILTGIVAGSLVMQWLDWPFWTAVAVMIVCLLVPSIIKWRADEQRYGAIVMGISFLLITQGFHTLEHVAQWVQFHVLSWDKRAAVGLLSPANSEWVHFVWNWIVVIVLLLLIWRGMRNFWIWPMLIWALAHTAEHTYMFVRYLQVLDNLRSLGITDVTAQGLPGFFGRDGWLARNAEICGPLLASFPGLATANRIDVHFWWNMGEISLLLLAAHQYLSTTFKTGTPSVASATVEPQSK